MHPAWQIDDIRNLIFERLEPQDFARLAQTCKAFFDVTTNELWKTITSFSPFLCFFPPDFRSQPLRAEDVQRLDFYSAKVQNLVLDSQSIQVVIRLPPQFQLKKKQPKEVLEKPWEDFWKEIAELRSTSEFLPNLQRIRINNVVEELLIPLIGISGSNLTQIYIKYIQYRQYESVVLKVLDRLHHTPKLEFLFVRDGGPDLVPSKLIQQSPLKHLRLDPRISAKRHEDLQFKEFQLRPEILQKSSLETLTLGLTRQWYGPGINALNSKYLPALKRLWLHLTTFQIERDPWPAFSGTPHNLSNGDNDWRRSPAVFLDGLDNPQLSLLHIKFPVETTGKVFLDVMSAANNSCQLQNLTTLELTGGAFFKNCPECMKHPGSKIKPNDLRTAMNMLLPMSQLEILRLSVAPNFLDVLDLELYKSITDGLPKLEKLWLGHKEFCTSSIFESVTYHERVPLHHLAAFCSMLPNLVEVSVGTVDCLTIEKKPRIGWESYGVNKLIIYQWADDWPRSGSRDMVNMGLEAYFPNSDLAKKGAPSYI